MLPIIATGNVASALPTGYNVANSCRFNDGDSSYLSQSTSSSTGKIFTFSFWMKKSTDGSNNGIFVMSSDSLSNNYIEIATKSANGLDVQLKNGSGGTFLRRKTTRVFRDFSAWMHICIRFDSTAAEANRLRIYVNGTQETAIDVDGTPAVPEDYVTDFNNSSTINIARNIADSHYYDGYLAEMVLVDGSSLAPTSFGEFDEDSPTIFKPIDVSGLTFGTNGFYLDFEDSGDLGDDESGQGNDFTEANLAAADQSTDTPTNSFATLNPLDNYYASSTFSEGNCTVVQGSSTYAWNLSTIAVSAGKWYVEAKITTDSDHALVGITDTSPVGTGTKILGSGAYDYSIKFENGDLFNNAGDDPANDDADYAAAYAQNDIIGIALDITNSKIYFSKGGAWSDGSGSWDSTTFDAAVGAVTITAPASTNNGHYFFASGDYGAASCTWEWNFGGCPAFAISSGNADANGYGNMEYAIPSGYYTLCTKNLAEYG